MLYQMHTDSKRWAELSDIVLLMERTLRNSRVKNREGEQYLFRFPPGLKKKLVERACENGRSLNSELVHAIEKHLSTDTVKNLEKRISKLEQMMHIS